MSSSSNGNRALREMAGDTFATSTRLRSSLRRETLLYRPNAVDAASKDRWIAYCRATAILSDARPAPPICLDYGTWSFERRYLAPSDALEWIVGVTTKSDWHLDDWIVRMSTVLSFTQNRTHPSQRAVLEYPAHWFMTRIATPGGYSDSLLQSAQHGVHPHWSTLANEQLGLEHANGSWLGEVHLLFPPNIARIEDVALSRSSLLIRLRLLPEDESSYSVAIWGQDSSGHLHHDVPVNGPEVRVKLRRPLDRLVVYLVSRTTAAVVDEWGNHWQQLVTPQPRELAAQWWAKILAGEDQFVEFKHYVPGKNRDQRTTAETLDVDNLAREMVAFANTNDGVVLLGVDDDATLRGIGNVKDLRAKITEIAHNNCQPPITPRFFEVTIDGTRILGIRVRGRSRPVVHQTNKHHVYVRRAGTARHALPHDFEEILQITRPDELSSR